MVTRVCAHVLESKSLWLEVVKFIVLSGSEPDRGGWHVCELDVLYREELPRRRTDSDERPVPDAMKLSSSASLSAGVQPGPWAISRTPAGVIRESTFRRDPGHGVCAGASANGSCRFRASMGALLAIVSHWRWSNLSVHSV